MTITTFITAMHNAGITTTDPIIADDTIRRIHVLGDRNGTKNAYYILDLRKPAAGFFGCFKRNIYQPWCSTQDKTPDLHNRLASMKKRANAAKDAERKQALTKAISEFNSAPVANGKHRYLLRKQVAAYGIRYHHGQLLIPLYDVDGNIHGIQTINHDGSKRFCFGTDKTGHFYMIGSPGSTILVAEGFATAATLYQVTGHAAVVAFDAGNLLPASQAICSKYPDIKLVFCADDDFSVSGNPGITAARNAALSTSSWLAVPIFVNRNSETDFNDLYITEGADAINSCVKMADRIHHV